MASKSPVGKQGANTWSQGATTAKSKKQIVEVKIWKIQETPKILQILEIMEIMEIPELLLFMVLQKSCCEGGGGQLQLWGSLLNNCVLCVLPASPCATQHSRREHQVCQVLPQQNYPGDLSTQNKHKRKDQDNL